MIVVGLFVAIVGFVAAFLAAVLSGVMPFAC